MSFFLDRFNEVKTTEDMEKFLSVVGGFHDGVLKEIHALNSAFVHENLSMAYSFKYDMRLLVQRQWKNPSAVEIILGNVIEVKLEEPDCIWSSSGKVVSCNADGISEITLDLDNSYFTCRRMFWRDASEWMGKKSRFGEYLSLDSLYHYEVLEDGWVMCSNCFEAWQPSQNSVVQCPKCSGLTSDCISEQPKILE